MQMKQGPAALPTASWFKHYTARFKTVELNAAFYAWPTPATVATWLRQAGRAQEVRLHREGLRTHHPCEEVYRQWFRHDYTLPELKA